MKKVLLIFIYSICISFSAKSLSPFWAWQHNFNGHISDIVYHSNFMYTTGTFTNNAFVFGNVNIVNHGGSDVIIMKWDTLGNLIWATSIWGTLDDAGVSIKVSDNGELVVAGRSNSTTINVAGNILTSNGGQDIFVARYDLNGNYVNAFIYGSPGNDNIVGMCTDYANYIYVASSGGITKFNNAGALIWQRVMPISEIKYSPWDAAIVVTGFFTGTFTLGAYSIAAAYSANWGVQPDVYAAKISLGNTPIWLINVSDNVRGDFDLKCHVDEQAGKVFVASSRLNFAASEVLTVRQISYTGVLANPAMVLPEYTDRCVSMSGKDSFLSFCVVEGGNGTNYIYNTNTNQEVTNYAMIGIGPYVYDNPQTSFQCFRGLHAIYAVSGNGVNFGKVSGAVLEGYPTNQNVYKCLGSLSTLSGNIVGGIGALTYSWLPVTGLNNTNTNTVSFTATSNITYTLTVSDQAGQIAKDTFHVIIESPIPPPNIIPQFPTFCSDSMQLTAGSGVAGTWMKKIGNSWSYLNQNGNSVSQTIYSPGKYGYQNYNVCGLVMDSLIIAPAITVDVNATSDTICAGQQLTLWGSGAFNYNWTGGVVNNIPFVPVGTQTYTVTGTDGNGCIGTASITVTVNPPPSAVIYSTPPFVCDQGNALLSVYPVQSYCVPTVNFNGLAYSRITNFGFNGINTSSGVNNFQTYNYYNLTSNVTAGNTYPITIYQAVAGIPQGGGQRKVWIDLNRDGDFTDAGEVVLNSTSNSAVLLTNITIPADAVNGKTRMRVGTTSTNPNFSPCNSNSGEYEDYNLFISGNNNNNVSWSPNTFLNNTFGTAVDVTNLNVTTTYTVTVADVIGCSSTNSFTINAFPNTTSYTNASICIDQLPYVWAGLNLDSPGVYTATIPNANGCDSVATLNLNISLCGLCQPDYTVNWTPFIDSLIESQTWIVTSGTVLIPIGAKVKFDANVGGYVQMNPGFKVDSGAVFIAQAYNGCTAGAPQLPQLGKAFNGDPFAANEIVLYPNPTSGMIHIKHDEKLTDIQIFDMVGKLIINQKCAGEIETNIDLSNLPNGVYHVKASGYNSIKVVKND